MKFHTIRRLKTKTIGNLFLTMSNEDIKDAYYQLNILENI